MRKRLVVAISGASGVLYGIKTLDFLRQTDIETHLIISEAGKMNIAIETDHTPEQVLSMADHVYDNHEISAAPASGSFLTHGMLVVPCTIKTLSGIANSYTENLIVRAADVTLKEKRKLVLMVRETPLHQGHLRLMMMAARNGAHILPPIPSFYHNPRTIEDIIHQSIGKMLDYMEIEHDLFERWPLEKKNKSMLSKSKERDRSIFRDRYFLCTAFNKISDVASKLFKLLTLLSNKILKLGHDDIVFPAGFS